MKRALCLLLLFAVWLLAAPGASAPQPVGRVATVSASDEARVSAAVPHVAPQLALTRVMRAPLWARLPVVPSLVRRVLERRVSVVAGAAPDLRAALRRVQTRRRVPRLSCEEPPWS